MSMRTVKVLGWGVGTANIVAVYNESTVFSGDVVLEEMNDTNQGEKTSPAVFSFDIPMEEFGTKKMSITVNNAQVRFGQIVANYTPQGVEQYGSGPNDYADVVDFDEEHNRDPRSNVKIDGVEQLVDRKKYGGGGTWHWFVNPGSTFEHDLTITYPGKAD